MKNSTTRRLFHTMMGLCVASTLIAAQALSQETMGSEKAGNRRGKRASLNPGPCMGGRRDGVQA